MELKGRLKLIADKVPECGTICDVGTDHAYIPIYLVKKKVCRKAIASDVRKGPVAIASENVKKNRLDNEIEVRLGDGLQKLGRSEAEVIIIAGMGGLLITEIMAKDIQKCRNAVQLILQPMNALEVLREWLYSNGFNIIDEGLVAEEDKIYNVICAEWVGNVQIKEEVFYHVGQKLIEKGDPLLKRYLVKKINVLDVKIDGLKKTIHVENELAQNEGLKCRMTEILRDLENEAQKLK